MVKVVVLGAGGAGMAAALSAATVGAEVVVLERTPTIGGSAAMGDGSCWLPGAADLIAAGRDTTTAAVLDYLTAIGGPKADIGRLRQFVQRAPLVAAALEAVAHLQWQPSNYPDNYDLPGGSAAGHCIEPKPLSIKAILGDRAGELRSPVDGPSAISQQEIMSLGGWTRYTDVYDATEAAERVAAGTAAQGQALAAGMYAGCLEVGVRFETDWRATQPSLDSTGRVVGAVSDDGRIEVGDAIIIATGGFEWNDDLRPSWLPGPELLPASPPQATGDGIRLGMELGAAVTGLPEAWWSPVVALAGDEWEDGSPRRRPIVCERSNPHSVIVNAAGKRFVNEAANHHLVGRALLDPRPSGVGWSNTPAWLVFDSHFRRHYRLFDLTPEADDPAWLFSAARVVTLAKEIGVDHLGMVATIDRFNDGAHRGEDPDFGRGSSEHDVGVGDPEALHPNLAPLDEGPFYAVQLHPGIVGTKGGLRVGAAGEVIDFDGVGMPGVFAAGNCIENVMAAGAPGAGAVLGTALVSGWIAGAGAAATTRPAPPPPPPAPPVDDPEQVSG